MNLEEFKKALSSDATKRAEAQEKTIKEMAKKIQSLQAELDRVKDDRRSLMNRCHASTFGAMCVWCSMKEYCTAKGECDCGGYYYSRAIEEAIELLEAREPKVMTLEEVEEAGGLIYYERKGEYGATPAYVYKVGEHSFDIMTMGNDGFQNEKSFYYKIGWRCWTSMPTDKQRKVVKWE